MAEGSIVSFVSKHVGESYSVFAAWDQKALLPFFVFNTILFVIFKRGTMQFLNGNGDEAGFPSK